MDRKYKVSDVDGRKRIRLSVRLKDLSFGLFRDLTRLSYYSESDPVEGDSFLVLVDNFPTFERTLLGAMFIREEST